MWYKQLFDNYARTYDNESFTQGTKGEVDFFEKEINFNKSAKILDIGCGTGRHTIELAKRGYVVTGFDLSESQLKRASEKAIEAGVKVDFQQIDARYFDFKQQYDLAIMICEGAFPLMETDEMNYMIIENAAKSLKSGGKFIFTTLSALFPLFHSIKDYLNSSMLEGNTNSNNHFDLMTFRETSVFEVVDDNGVKKMLDCNERYYTPSEITWLLKTANFENISILGCPLGRFSRDIKLTTDDYEMLVIAEKK